MKKWIIIACILIVLGIILGAFGAHGLKGKLTEEQLLSFETGVKFQIYHGLAFLALPFILEKYAVDFKVLRLILIGLIVFSGSIYLLTLRHLIHVDVIQKIAGPITPIGGLVLIIGWISIILKLKDSK